MQARDLVIWLGMVGVGAAIAWTLLGRRAEMVPPELATAVSASLQDPLRRAQDLVVDRGGWGQAIPFEATPVDWEIVQSKVQEARARGLADRPMGEVVAAVGLTFVGTPYEPGTLEVPGPERLVVNLRALDCVTFVENALVLADLVKTVPDEVAEDREALAAAYRERLIRLRYRSGVLQGYPSRLHYFSEWLSDNERKGVLQVITADLPGARRDARPLTFMTENPEAYRQIAEDPSILEEIRIIEQGLTTPRWYIPQDRIEAAAAGGGIRDGDIIAAKSTLDGLDVAHTGIALWRGDRLHLLHAPLVGDSVEVTPVPLGDRIRGLRAQDGILVARPLEPRAPERREQG